VQALDALSEQLLGNAPPTLLDAVQEAKQP
jgi:hypothetical protein